VKRYTITADNGELLSPKQAGDIIEMHRESIIRYIKKGAKTLSDVQKMKKKGAHNNRNLKLFFFDHGRKIGVREMYEITNIPRHTLTHYVKKGCVTIADVLARQKLLLTDPTGHGIFATKYETIYGKLTVSQIMEIHPFRQNLTYSCLTGRLTRRGGMCSSLWWNNIGANAFRAKLIDEGIEKPTFGVNPNFDDNVFDFKQKSKHCIKQQVTCRHYSSCLSYRSDNKTHHPRYKKNRCFTEPEEERSYCY